MDTKTEILVVDDNIDLTMILQDTLKGEGYNVMVAHDGKTALAICQENRFDLALIDIKLPDMPGIELINKFGEISPETDYVIITAYADVKTAINAVGHRKIVGYQTKPLDMNNLLILTRQVSKQKQTEEALRTNEARFRELFGNIQSGVAVYEAVDGGEDFIFKDFNKGAEKIDGISRETVVGKRLTEVFPGVKEFGVFDVFQRVWRTGKAEHFPDAMYRDERIIGWRDNNIYKLPSGEVVAVYEDITERKQAEKSLQESEEKYRTILESIQDGYYEVDLAGNFTFFNDSMCEISGYSRDELMGMNYRQYTNEQDSEKLYNTLNKVYTTGKPSGIMDHVMVRKDGTERYIELSGSLIKDAEGHRVGFQGIIRDVTERKHTEKERAKLQDQLQQAKKMETIGILAGGVAHDLNNILSGIISYPELLLLDLPEDSPLRKPLLTIQKSGEKAAVVVQDLLTLARRGVTITEIVNLNSIISEQLKSPEYEKLRSFHPDVDIETNLEKDLLNIKGSTAHLSKTVMNLISNAAEAMPDGGKVLVSTENLYIDRPIRGYDHVAEGDYVVVTVIDTGIGISKEDIERIFEPFYTKKVMGRSGSGLGMSVVWGTVKDHNGYIDVKSIKGKGTTFTLYFPIIREELAIDNSLLSIEDYMGKGESILIVDDVEEQREIASVMLKKLGYSVTSVSSGEEAIEYMKDNSVDLLILDMIMDPGIDGLDTYKKILELHPNQKAIIASGFSETDRVKEAKKLGAGAYVKKPYVLEKIGLVIKEELEK